MMPFDKGACLPRSRGEHLDRNARLVGARPSRTVLGTSREACDTRSVMTILVSQAAISHLWPFRPRTRPGKQTQLVTPFLRVASA